MYEYVTGETIRELREKKGYTQKELADVLALSDKTISKWGTGADYKMVSGTECGNADSSGATRQALRLL